MMSFFKTLITTFESVFCEKPSKESRNAIKKQRLFFINFIPL
jgi:hypothetical protein